MNIESHLLKAKWNKKFLHKILLPILDKCPDWCSIVAFYGALHFMEAFLKKNFGKDFEHHIERHRFMSRNVPTHIFSAYYRLYDLGFDARYKSEKDAPTRDEAGSAIQYDLTDVEDFVLSQI